MTLLYTVVSAIGALAATFMLGMRYKWPFVLDFVRQLNKAVLNPRQMRTAGTPGAYAGIIHHVGRRSGRDYRTPVGIVADGAEMFIVLPYGTRPDWLKNVLAAGSATITHEGATYQVDQPRLAEIRRLPEVFGTTEQFAQKLFGVDRCLRLRTVRQLSGTH
jgi:deazaflavin-dependent oxidoreductase (nitroreductase family)